MAESTTKTGKLKKFPKSKTIQDEAQPPESVSTAVAEPPEPETPFDSEPEAAEPAAPAKHAGGRPKKDDNAPPKAFTFFERIAKINPQDWGNRAKIKVYRLQPITNRLVNSEFKFVTIYGTPGEPPLTEEQLKVDHGSGKYRLYLNYKAPNSEDRELDRVDVDILDPAFPPNIPAGEWLNDPRNKQWAWAKPKEAELPAAPRPLSEVVEALRVSNEIRKEAREELKDSQPTPAAAAAVVNPWDAAEKILNMRSDNPMVTFVTAQLTAMQATMDKAAEREANLQKELRDMLVARAQQPPTQQKGLLESLTELAGVADKLAPLAGLFGFTRPNPASATEPIIVKSRMSGTMEFLSDLVPKIIDSPIMNAIAQKITQAPQAPNPTINVTPQPTNGTAGQQPQQQPNPQAELFRFVNQHITPPLIEFLRVENSGTEFAQWVYTGFPLERLEALQQITHEMMPGQKGAPVIIQLYKHAHNGLMWKEFLGEREAQFTKFVEEFCAWRPPSDEDEAPAPISTDESRETANQGDF